MEWKFKFIDVKKALSEGKIPEDYIPRGSSDIWVYLDDNIQPSQDQTDGFNEKNPVWRFSKTGDTVHVPMHAYVTTNTEPAIALSLAFQLAAEIFVDWERGNIQEVCLVIGLPVEEVSNYVPVNNTHRDCLRFWLGIALKVKDL